MNNTTKWTVGIIIAVVVVAVGYSIKGPGEPVETGPIKIGLVAPLSGGAASYGEAMLGGVELAVKEINDAGGISGRMIELIVEDDELSAKGGANAFNKLVQVDKVTAIVGPLVSASAGAALPIAQKAGVPVIFQGSAPKLTEVGDYVFRNYPSDAFQGKFLAEFIINDLKKSNIAIVYIKNDWGEGIKKVFTERAKELGGNVVYEEGILQDTTDMRTVVAKLKQTNPDAIFMPVYPTNAIGIKQIKEAGIQVPIIGGDAFGGEEVWNIKESDGVFYAAAKTLNPEEFQNKVETVTGKTPNIFTPFGYDAVMIFASIIERVGTDKAAIKSELEKIVYKDAVAVSVVEFDDTHNLKEAVYDVMIIKNGVAELYTQ